MIKFNKKAMQKFNQIPDDIKSKILSNVYCSSCKDTVKIVFKDTIKPIRTILKKPDKLKVIVNGKIYYKKNMGDTPYHSIHDEEDSETFIYRSSKTNNCYDIRDPKKIIVMVL